MMQARAFGRVLAFASMLMALPGCVTGMTPGKLLADAAGANAQSASLVEPDASPQTAGTADQPGYTDRQVAAVGDTPPDQTPAATAMMPATGSGQPASLTLQTTGLQATSSSIFSVRMPGAAPVATDIGGSAQQPLPIETPTGVEPATSSLFSTMQPQPAPARLPLEGASNAEPQTSAAVQLASADTAALPVAVPIPAVRAEHAVADAADAFGLFQRAQDKVPENGQTSPRQTTALGYNALPGIRTQSMFATVDDAQPGHDDRSPEIDVAALTGLARLAPSALWLQTENVETGCFKPDLMKILTTVEGHYGRKLTVTSGWRGFQHNKLVGGRPHSLHTTCEAADIQVPGVSKWELASYLRTLPGRGGVGTYCHTASVHVDTGKQRDWNWACPIRDA